MGLKPNGRAKAGPKKSKGPSQRRQKKIATRAKRAPSAEDSIAIGSLDPQLLADHIAKKSRNFMSDLSLIELEELLVSGNSITDTTEWTAPRTEANIGDFLIQFCSKQPAEPFLKQASDDTGSPHTLVVAASGIRAADLTRALRQFQTKDSTVAKLFAKHIKLAEAIEFTGKSRIGIGVGTPLRIHDLLNSGSLKTTALRHVLIDASFLDMKKRSILDMRETEVPLVKLLGNPQLKSRLGRSLDEVKLLFF